MCTRTKVSNHSQFHKIRRSKYAIFSLVLLLILSFSLNAQIPPSPSDLDGYKGLFAAALNDDSSAVRRLVSQGADPNGRDSHGRTPLHVAAYMANHKVMGAFLAAGSDPNAMDNQLYDIITIAAVADDVLTLKVALDLGGDPTNITSPYDGTALIAAAHLGHVEVVRSLVEAGAPLDHVNNLGWTALIEAIILGDGGEHHTATVKILLDAGANIYLADRNRRTPLLLAQDHGYDTIIKMLIHAEMRGQ